MFDLSYLTQAFIKNYRKRIAVSRDINYGDCYRWAMLAQRLHGGQLISVTVMIEDPNDDIVGQLKPDGSHAFLYLEGKYYDAESPEGVDNWQELKYFNRLDLSVFPSWEYEIREHPSMRSFKRFWRPTLNVSRADNKLYNKLKAARG